ncbi:MAG: chloride channel protein, partial [Spirochaetia bacterium]|nr:chloride channel protein [Spirochaetia bacterium]
MSFSFRLARSVGAWITQHISEQNRLLLLSILTGLVAGCAAVTLKILVHSISRQSAVGLGANPLIIAALPSVGILLSILFVRFIVRQPAGTTADILLAIMRKSSLVERFKLYSHFVGSALTVGFGGSAGLESPIAITGAAIGSNIGRIVNYRHRTLLLSCGAAAGIAAV